MASALAIVIMVSGIYSVFGYLDPLRLVLWRLWQGVAGAAASAGRREEEGRNEGRKEGREKNKKRRRRRTTVVQVAFDPSCFPENRILSFWPSCKAVAAEGLEPLADPLTLLRFYRPEEVSPARGSKNPKLGPILI